MEMQKIINLLNDSTNEEPNFARKYGIDIETAKGKYNQNNSIKCETECIKSSLCDYSNVFILVTRNKTTVNNNTAVAFENLSSFFTCKTEIDDVFID